jgi:AcrR family transcriptional regulator
MARGRTSAAELVAAAGEILDAEGLAAVTMRAVGERAGVSAMAIYRHFADRDELIQAVVDQAFADLAREMNPLSSAEPEQALTMIAALFVDVALGQPNRFAAMFTDRRPGARVLPVSADQSPTLGLVIRVLRRGVSEGIFAGDDMAEVAVIAAAMIQGLCLARCAGRIGGTDDEFRALVDRAVERTLHGLRR